MYLQDVSQALPPLGRNQVPEPEQDHKIAIKGYRRSSWYKQKRTLARDGRRAGHVADGVC